MEHTKDSNTFYINSIYEVIKNQSDYLPTKTLDLINDLNQIYNKSDELIKKYDAKCLILLNLGQNSFELALGFLKSNNELIFLYDEFELKYNDGKSFGLDDYEMFVEEHPTEDLFNSFRSEALNNLFYNWIVEGVWNSHLMTLSLPLIYSANTDCDTLSDLRNGWMKYDNFEFLNNG